MHLHTKLDVWFLNSNLQISGVLDCKQQVNMFLLHSIFKSPNISSLVFHSVVLEDIKDAIHANIIFL